MERQLLLLGVLRAQKMYGYQLNDFLEKHYDFVTDLKPSTAYYLLDRLAADGYVQMHQEQVGHRPQRRVYEITPKGDAYFFELLRQNLRGHAKPVYGDEVGLAFLNEIPPQEAYGYLAEKHKLLLDDQARFGAMEEILRRDEGRDVYLTLTHHLTMVRAELGWLERLLDRLKNEG